MKATGRLIDAVPVVHARWEEISAPGSRYKLYGCSHCHAAKSAANDVPYCSNCGAHMDKKGIGT